MEQITHDEGWVSTELWQSEYTSYFLRQMAWGKHKSVHSERWYNLPSLKRGIRERKEIFFNDIPLMIGVLKWILHNKLERRKSYYKYNSYMCVKPPTTSPVYE